MESFGKFAFMVLLIAFSILFNAWYLGVVWDWFAVTSFNMDKLTIAQCISIGVVKEVMFFKLPK